MVNLKYFWIFSFGETLGENFFQKVFPQTPFQKLSICVAGLFGLYGGEGDFFELSVEYG